MNLPKAFKRIQCVHEHFVFISSSIYNLRKHLMCVDLVNYTICFEFCYNCWFISWRLLNILKFKQDDIKPKCVGFSVDTLHLGDWRTMFLNGVMQSDRNSTKTEKTFHEPETNEPHVEISKQILNFCLTRIRTSRSFSNKNKIIRPEVIVYQKVVIFQLFLSDCITLYTPTIG